MSFRTGLGRTIATRSLTEQAAHWRVSSGTYAQPGDSAESRIAISVYSPGVDNSRLKNVAPELRNRATGTVAVAYETTLLPKDRLVIDGRTFEVIAPISPDDKEWLHRAVVREIHTPERVLYLCLKPADGHDGASNTEPLPELIPVVPFAYVTDKPVEIARQDEGDSFVAAQLKQIEVREVARAYFGDAYLARLLYCLLVPSDETVTAEDARDGVHPRYRFNGSPVMDSYEWARNFCWSVNLVENK